MTEAFAGYCLRYPAFLDCSLALMRRPREELRESVSESVWLRLGQGMAGCIEPLDARSCDGASTSTTPTTRPTSCGRRRSA